MAKMSWIGTLILLVLIGSCSPPPKPAPAAPPAPVVVKEGVLTYVSGEVSAQVNGTWAPVDTGDKVSESSTIKTEKNATCDLQFGQLGVLHIAENSVVALKTVGLSDSKKAVDLQLVSGVVTAKVSKLLQDQRFQVSTNTVVCGVRGTRFMVSQKKDQKTSIAVAEGSVALVPPTYDPKTLENLTDNPEQAAVVKEAMEKILASSPTVTVGKEVEVTKAQMEKPAEAVSQIVETLKAVAAAPPPPPAPAQEAAPAGSSAPAATPAPAAPSVQIAALQAALTKSLDSYQKVQPAAAAPVIKPMSAQTEQVMKQTVDLKITEKLPEKAPEAAPAPAPTPPPAPAAPPPLTPPKPVSPPAGAQIDIHTTSSITFAWKAATGATSYEVSLASLNGDQKTVVKTWTTTGLSVVLDKFDKFQPGSFVWEVKAIREASGTPTEKSAPAQVIFQIGTQGQLSAPVLDLGN